MSLQSFAVCSWLICFAAISIASAQTVRPTTPAPTAPASAGQPAQLKAFSTYGSVVGTEAQSEAASEETTTSPEPNEDAKSEEDEAAKQKAEADKKKAERAKRKQQRLQKIQKLNFDRRPSTILKVWSESAQKQYPKPDEPSTAKQDAAKKDTAAETAAGAVAPSKPAVDPFDEDIKIFQRQVTLGEWPPVEHYLMDLPADEGKALYQRLLQTLRGAPANMPAGLPPAVQAQLQQLQQLQTQQRRGQPETNLFALEDVVALAACAPHELDDNAIAGLGAILRQVITGGSVTQKVVARLTDEIDKPRDRALDKRQAAKLLFAAGQAVEVGPFLPTVEDATSEDDYEALNLLSRYYLALDAKEKSREHMEQAWHVTQAVLAIEEATKAEREQALQRAVDLATKIRDELGQAWLEESFTGQPERGMAIIAAIGATTSQGLQTQAQNPVFRLKGLQLQTAAVEALLQSSPQLAGEWRTQLTLLAGNWLKEANTSYQFDQSTRRGPNLQRDMYGNFFYNDQNAYYGRNRQPSRIQAVKTGDLLEIRPSGRWLELVDENLRPKFDMVFAQLHLKVNEEDDAFPYIEQLAKVYPSVATGLVDEFLRVWTQNHDPNANRNRTNYYMFMYGYERKAESIPLTRSKQQRNLKELSSLVKRLRALPLEKLNEQLLARAFTTCHSSAEVYRLEAIETVFGSMDNLEPKTLAELAQQMRANLIGVWRQPAEQKKKKTNRKQKDIQAEVLRGYSVAQAVIDRGLKRHPDHWALQLAKASLRHDENNYHKELSPDSEFSQRRDDAFAGFQKAAEFYAGAAGDLAEEDESTRVYELWYYASLGACDLAHVSDDKVPDLRQPARIREAILALPDERAERHMSMFANTLFTRMSAVKPAVKFRYVRTGLEIVGDHEQAAEARKVYDYYKDLVTEIKLEAVVDGTDVVGHTKPFGLFVNLRHTREIERESGGFGRYLQNQNNRGFYYYNYGRPLENYRDKFEEIVQQSLEEQFDILSVTFQSEDVHSKAVAEYGWRVTPYAYVLLRARGPEIDKIPPLRLDLDFLDTSGYAVIPVESPAVPVDAAPEAGDARPVEKLAVTQTLDERQADEGKLILEVKATAQGLVPDLDDLLDVTSEGFEITETEDQGVSVSRFDPESDDTVVVSERTWMVTMQAPDDLPQRPTSFEFGDPKLDLHEAVYQRYNDADLLAVEQVISLEEQYGEASLRWLWLVVPVAFIAAAAIMVVVWLTRAAPTVQLARFQMPDNVTPFTVLGLLKRIEANNGLNDSGRRELHTSINHLEQHYFIDGSQEEPDLRGIAETWVQRTG